MITILKTRQQLAFASVLARSFVSGTATQVDGGMVKSMINGDGFPAIMSKEPPFALFRRWKQDM